MGLFNRKRDEVLSEGSPTTAVVVEVADRRRFESVDNTRISDLGAAVGLDLGMGHVKDRYVLEVTPPTGGPPYLVDRTFKVPARHEGDLDVGMTVPVRVAAGDPQAVEIDWAAWAAAGGDPAHQQRRQAEAQAQAHATFGASNRNMMLSNWLAAAQSGAMSRQELDTNLDMAVRTGMATAAEVAEARAQLG